MADEREAKEDSSKGSDGNGSSAEEVAQQKAEESEQAADEMRKLEEGDPPEKLEDWPDGAAKYKTYGIEGDESYDQGVTAKLGPSDLKRHADGSIEIKGEKVDNPDDYKDDPIPGGPTDKDSPD